MIPHGPNETRGMLLGGGGAEKKAIPQNKPKKKASLFSRLMSIFKRERKPVAAHTPPSSVGSVDSEKATETPGTLLGGGKPEQGSLKSRLKNLFK